MANPKHLEVLKQGVAAWNQWRREHPDIKVDLREADLYGDGLYQLEYRGADMTRVDLEGARLRAVRLREANFNRANLKETNLVATDLTGSNLSIARLRGAHFGETILDGTNFSGASLGWTTFADTNLSRVKGLQTVKHEGPSTIGIDTIIRSQGHIPESFLREAGVPDSIIEAIPALIGSLKPIDFYSCFISYSSQDQDFAERLYNDLQGKGVRCWFAPEDMKIGDKLRPRIEESIRLYDKLLLVLSEHSIVSNWVAYEVERALNKEPEGIPNVLFPIRLDNTVMESKAVWANDIRRTRHIGDFTRWKHHDAYQKAFNRLLRDLKADERR